MTEVRQRSESQLGGRFVGLGCEVLVFSERAGALTTHKWKRVVSQTSCDDFGRGWKQTDNQKDGEECVENELMDLVARG